MPGTALGWLQPAPRWRLASAVAVLVWSPPIAGFSPRYFVSLCVAVAESCVFLGITTRTQVHMVLQGAQMQVSQDN